MFMRINLSMGLSAIAMPWVYDIQTTRPSPFLDQGFLRAVPVDVRNMEPESRFTRNPRM